MSETDHAKESAAPSPSPDLAELGALLAAFDQTTARLQASHDALQQRVAELSGELQQKNEALSASFVQVSALKNYLANILESITDGVLAIDLEKRVVALNEAAAALIPNLASDHEGVLIFELLPEVCNELGRVLVRALEEELPITNLEVQFPDAAGVTRTLSLSASPIRSEQGRLLGAVETFRDLTEMKSLEQRAAQQERLAALGEMAAGVAHEIRNPLGGIELYASTIKRKLPEESRERELADRIMAAAGSLNRIVTDMLTFTRGRAPVKEAVPVERLLRSTADLAGIQFEAKGLSLVFGLEVGEALVRLDAELLGRALLNVLLNAAQASPVGGRIWLEARFFGGGGGRRLLLAVADEGPGVPLEVRDRIFHPFFTQRKEGTGLGLAIVHKILQDHGGGVTVGDRTGGGACFTLELPAPGA